MRVGMLDLGSNSFTVLVADVEPDRTMHRVYTRSEQLHLAASVAGHGAIPDGRAKAAIETAAQLANEAREHGVNRIRVVATAAFRDAPNGVDVLRMISDVCHAPIELVDGQHESELALRGAQWGFEGSDALLVADLGGGCLNLASGAVDGVPEWLLACRLGVSHIAAIFSPSERLERHHRIQIDAHVDHLISGALPLADRTGQRPLVLVGGTARAIGQLLSTWRRGGEPDAVHGCTLTTGDLNRVVESMAGLSMEERVRMPGVDAGRARLLPVGAAILRQMMRTLDVSSAVVGETGIREAVVLDTATRAATNVA